MKCVILAAGRGTRMGELCDDTPKPMLHINGRPKLAWSVESLPGEIDEVVFVVGYLQEVIREYFGVEFDGRKISYVEQKELNGTGGAAMLVRDLVGDEKFLVLMGDDLYATEDLSEMMRHDFALLAYETHQAQQFGLVEMDESNKLLSVVERPHSHSEGFVNTAAYVLGPAFFDMDLVAISDTEYGLPQTLVAYKDEYPIEVITTKKWFAIGDPEALELAEDKITEFIN